MEQNTKFNLSCGFTQYGFNMDEIISKSKVVASFKKSSGEINSAQTVELQKIDEIVTNENRNLIELTQKCENVYLRSNSKLQVAFNCLNSLLVNMRQVTASCTNLKKTIDELDAHKCVVEQRNGEINNLWEAVSVIQHEKILEMNRKVHVFQEDIHNIQLSIKLVLEANSGLESEQNELSTKITGLNEKLVHLENDLGELQDELVLETNKNSINKEKSDKLQSVFLNKSTDLVEKKTKFEHFYNDSLLKLRDELENELDKEILIKTNNEQKIAIERASIEAELQKIDEQIVDVESLRPQIEILKNKCDEMREKVDLIKNERIKEESLLMEKTRRVEALRERNLEKIQLLHQNKLENNKLDKIHQAEEMDVNIEARNESQLLREKKAALISKIGAIRQEIRRSQTPVAREIFSKRVSLSRQSQIAERDEAPVSLSFASQPGLATPRFTTKRSFSSRLISENKQVRSRSTDEMSFLSNISNGSDINAATVSSFKLPNNFLAPVPRRKPVDILKPRPATNDELSSDTF